MRTSHFIAAAVFSLSSAAFADDINSNTTPDDPGAMQQPMDHGDDMAGQNPSGAATNPAPSEGLTPELTLERIHAINLAEIKAGKLAQSNGSATIQTYASRLIKDHKAADKQVKETAKSLKLTILEPSKVTWPADVQENQKNEMAMMDQLKNLRGTAFDHKFLAMMSSGHQEGIDFLTQAKQAQLPPQIATLIGKLLPTFQEHKQMADDLANQENSKVQGRR